MTHSLRLTPRGGQVIERCSGQVYALYLVNADFEPQRSCCQLSGENTTVRLFMEEQSANVCSGGKWHCPAEALAVCQLSCHPHATLTFADCANIPCVRGSHPQPRTSFPGAGHLIFQGICWQGQAASCCRVLSPQQPVATLVSKPSLSS